MRRELIRLFGWQVFVDVNWFVEVQIAETGRYWTELGKLVTSFVREGERLGEAGRWCGEMQFIIRGTLCLLA
jgi:hypothetical protein